MVGVRAGSVDIGPERSALIERVRSTAATEYKTKNVGKKMIYIEKVSLVKLNIANKRVKASFAGYIYICVCVIFHSHPKPIQHIMST